MPSRFAWDNRVSFWDNASRYIGGTILSLSSVIMFGRQC